MLYTCTVSDVAYTASMSEMMHLFSFMCAHAFLGIIKIYKEKKFVHMYSYYGEVVVVHRMHFFFMALELGAAIKMKRYLFSKTRY